MDGWGKRTKVTPGQTAGRLLFSVATVSSHDTVGVVFTVLESGESVVGMSVKSFAVFSSPFSSNNLGLLVRMATSCQAALVSPTMGILPILHCNTPQSPA